jgi:hypothetical protein
MAIGGRPYEARPVHPLREQAHTLAIIPEQLHQIASLPPEGQQRPGMRALLQNLLRHHREAVKPLAHVGRTAGQEDPRRWQQRDHRVRTPITRDRASASIAASNLIEAEEECNFRFGQRLSSTMYD